jgi:hypothetical protein
MVFKIKQKYFENCLFLWKTKTCPKGTVARDFYLRFFCSWIFRIPWPRICRKLRKWSSQVADLKLRTLEKNCDFGSASFKLRNCDCGLKKKLSVPTSADGYFYKTSIDQMSQDTTSKDKTFSCKTSQIQNFLMQNATDLKTSQLQNVWNPNAPATERANLRQKSKTSQASKRPASTHPKYPGLGDHIFNVKNY